MVFKNPLQLAEIIVELPFMWKLSSYIASMLITKENAMNLKERKEN